MKRFDMHCHADSADPEKWDIFANAARENETIAAVVGGMRYGERDYLPNEEVLSQCRRHPDCLVPFAKLDLWETANPDEVYRYAEMGFQGFKGIYPYYEYDHDLYMPVYEAIEKCGLPVFFHTGNYRPCQMDTVYRRPMLKNMHPINLDRICRAFPKLHVVMAHMGTRFFQDEASQFLKMLPNLYADLAGGGQYMRIQAAELAELMAPDEKTVDVEMNGFRKLVLGSDSYITWPHLLGRAQHYYHELLDRIGVPQPIVEGIMGKTVASWLDLTLEE
ncbi:MAG: amidohydrolase family protein [Victivallales bacterium]|nr:amidohydrolase family protein [Victivallales bacterium]